MSRVHWRTGAIVRRFSPPAGIDIEAAVWLERLHAEPGERTRAAFERWRAADRANADVFARVEAAHAAARDLADAPRLLALRHETLTRLVVTPRESRWRPALAAGIAAVMIVSASLFAAFPGSSPAPAPAPLAAVEPNLYQTAIGERLAVSLPDGSTVMLNTASRLRVAYTSAERRLVLEAGQALFEVAKGQPRPFVVVAGDREVTALGTAFDVRLAAHSVEVKLIEGEVVVAPRRGGASVAAMSLKPNDILTVSGSAVSVRKADDVAQLTSWRDGLIVFDNDRLADAVGEVNRYTRRPLVLADGAVGEIRISGAFRTGETDAFVEALELGFGVEVVESGPTRVVLAAGD